MLVPFWIGDFGTSLQLKCWSLIKRRENCAHRFCGQQPLSLCLWPSPPQLARLPRQRGRAVEVACRMALAKAKKPDGTAHVFLRDGVRVKRSVGATSALRHPAGADS